jgi:uncharacterized protein (TIGR02117 family)
MDNASSATTTPTRRRRVLRWLVRAAAVLLAPLVLYFVAALALGAIPTGSNAPRGADSIAVYLCSNGVHVDFVVPIANDVHDWSRDLSTRGFAFHRFSEDREGRDWLAFGWGDRRFFLETKTWSDLRASVAVQAMFWMSSSAMHVEYVYEPTGDYPAGRIWLSREQYRDLCDYILDSFRRDARGAPIAIDAPGYGDFDGFYESAGSYSLIGTCNEWVGAGLRRIGARTGLWTPFEFQILMHVERLDTP